MEKSDNLFELVKSLSKSEKRYFKLVASMQNGEKKYLTLFEFIDAQKGYNKEHINLFFQKEKIEKKSPYKAYLYKLILKSLNQYHSQNSIKNNIKEWLKSVEILFDKELFSQSYRLLLKCKKSAYEYEKNLQLVEILWWEEKLALKVGNDIKANFQNPREHLNEMNLIFEKIKNNSQYAKLTSELFFFHDNNYSFRNEEQEKKIETLMNNALLKDEARALSLDALLRFYNIKALYHFMKGDNTKQFEYYEKTLYLIEQNAPEKMEGKEWHSLTLKNIISTQLPLKKYNDALTNLSKLKALKLKSKREEKSVYYFICSAKLHIYHQQGKVNRGIDIINSIGNKLKTLTNNVTKITLLFEYIKLYFLAGENKKALKYMNKLLNETDISLRGNIYTVVQVFQLVIHYELKNYESLGYFTKSTYRFLYKKQQLYPYEILILDFIRKSSKTTSQKQLIEAFKNLKTELKGIFKESSEKWVLDEFDIINWIESKIEGKSMIEIKKELK